MIASVGARRRRPLLVPPVRLAAVAAGLLATGALAPATPPGRADASFEAGGQVAREAGTAPLLRVGLADEVPVARISAPAPFAIRAGELLIEARDVLVGPESGPPSSVVALGSFAREAQARAAVAVWTDAGGEARVQRAATTGRFLAVPVRAPGNGAPGETASGRPEGLAVERLREHGFPGAGVFEDAVPEGEALMVRPWGGLPIRIPAGVRLEFDAPAVGMLEWEGAPYRGTLEVFRSGRGVTVVNRVGLEDYLLGVLPEELPPDRFPEIEALKAQALAARTYALRPRAAWKERGYDLCSGPGCQVYGGAGVEHPMASAAVRATAGEALFFEGRLIDALYTAACGGHTENAENVFSTPTPYLVTRACVRESGGVRLAGGARRLPLDLALLHAGGVLPAGWSDPEVLAGDAGSQEVETVLDAVAIGLGLGGCEPASDPPGSPADGGPGRAAPVTLDAFVRRLDARRCLPAPLPDTPRGRERRGESPVMRLVREGLFDPGERGLDADRAVSRREVAEVIGRLWQRERPGLRRGQVRRLAGDAFTVEIHDAAGDAPGGRESVRLRAAPGPALYRELRPTRIPGRADPLPVRLGVEELRIRPGDFVRFRAVEPGDRSDPGETPGGLRSLTFDVLVLEDLGETWDRFSAQSAWLVPRDAATLTAAAARVRPIGDVVALTPLEFGVSGRIVRLRVVGTSGDLELRGLEIRRFLGLSENLFFAEPRLGSDDRLTGFWFHGRGWGHGLGLCQAGAYGMAAAGADYRAILAHYYPGTGIAPGWGARDP